MGVPSPSERRAALEAFARQLAGLRDAAGAPSYREMAARSGAISHTTLHDAVRGARLPSWETVVEFAKACDADPEALRADWQHTVDVVRGSTHEDAPGPAPTIPRSLPAASEADTARSSAVAADRPETSIATAAPRGGSRKRLLAVLVVLAVVLAAAATWLAVSRHGDEPRAAAPETSEASHAAADCPVQAPNIPSRPLHAGDHARFVTDVTLPDCSHVPPASTVRKTWRLQNTGTIAWHGYVLHRLDPSDAGTCQTIADVPVPAAAPGATVDVTTTVTTPARPTFCYVRFKLADSQGHLAFEGGKPITFQLVVD